MSEAHPKSETTPILSLREKVAQCFILGTQQAEPLDDLSPFFETGLGGFIAFRHNFDAIKSAAELKSQLAALPGHFQGAGLSFIGLDQEGGQVERLPHWLFPAGCNAVALGHKNPHWVARYMLETTQRLRWLGFNLNFAPCVDVNTQLENPIIGVRSYGSSATLISTMGKAVMQAHLDAGLLPVAKHFPGHGSGTVDSHIALPTFENWEESEWQPYETLVNENVPAVLLAHGLYPELSKYTQADKMRPASLNPAFYQDLLAKKLGFYGLTITDDLSMGALQHYGDPAELTLQAIDAGANMVIWRNSLPEGVHAFEAVVKAYESGKLPESHLNETVQKILIAKRYLAEKPVATFSDEALSDHGCHQQSLSWASQCLVELKHQAPSPLPLNRFTPWALVAPDTRQLVHYQNDGNNGHTVTFDAWASSIGFPPKHVATYNPTAAAFYPDENDTEALPLWRNDTLDVIVFVAFNSVFSPLQQAYYQQLQLAHPQAKLILVSGGMPSDGEILPAAWVHYLLPSLRPAAMHALIQKLCGG